jgi:hypothetical protein
MHVKHPQIVSWRELKRHVLSLRQDETGWALVTHDGEVLYHAEGPYARRRLLLVARDFDALTVR